MRRLATSEKIFDNSFDSQFEYYIDGRVVSRVKYRLTGESICFTVCTLFNPNDVSSRTCLCNQAILDAYQRKLTVSVLSQTMCAVIATNPTLTARNGCTIQRAHLKSSDARAQNLNSPTRISPINPMKSVEAAL